MPRAVYEPAVESSIKDQGGKCFPYNRVKIQGINPKWFSVTYSILPIDDIYQKGKKELIFIITGEKSYRFLFDENKYTRRRQASINLKLANNTLVAFDKGGKRYEYSITGESDRDTAGENSISWEIPLTGMQGHTIRVIAPDVYVNDKLYYGFPILFNLREYTQLGGC